MTYKGGEPAPGKMGIVPRLVRSRFFGLLCSIPVLGLGEYSLSRAWISDEGDLRHDQALETPHLSLERHIKQRLCLIPSEPAVLVSLPSIDRSNPFYYRT